MTIIKSKDIEINLVPKTKKVIELTEKLNGKSLNDLLFNGLNDGDIKTLAEILKAFSEKEDGTPSFMAISNVYDFIDNWVIENQKPYTELYKEVIRVVNDMGFLKTKMESEKLEEEMSNPFGSINMNELITNAAQTAVSDIAKEEFRGYKG